MSKEKDTKKEQEELKDSEMEQNTAATAETDNAENAEKQEEKDPLEAANEQIAELKDKYLRSVAEFDNYRKRSLTTWRLSEKE